MSNVAKSFKKKREHPRDIFKDAKEEKEQGYYSSLDFENLYKKKKIKLKNANHRERSISDSELFENRKGYKHIYKQKHIIEKKKIYLFDNVEIDKNYFSACAKNEDNKIRMLKKILKLYEQVSTNEKKKLYELIKFFSFTYKGFQDNKLRQKIWLLLLGFNINISKEKNYNEHPISKLCNKRKKNSEEIESLNRFKLKWSREVFPFNAKKQEIRNRNKTKRRNIGGMKYIHNTKVEYHKMYPTMNKKEMTPYCSSVCSSVILEPSSIINVEQRKKIPLYPINDILNLRKNDCHSKSWFIKDSHLFSFSSSSSSSSYTSHFVSSSDSSISSASSTSSSVSSHSLSCDSNEFAMMTISKWNKNADPMNFLSNLKTQEFSSFSSVMLSKEEGSNLEKTKECTLKNKKNKCREHRVRQGIFLKKEERKWKPKRFYDGKGKKSDQWNQADDEQENYYIDMERKIRKNIQRKSSTIVQALLSINEENTKEDSNKNIMKNKKFLIKLLKFIYNNLLEVDIYIVDCVMRKGNIQKNSKENKNSVFSYLKSNVKNECLFNSNIKKWMIDSILLDEGERNQVKKDVKRSVNTWSVHRNNIYELKKRYQYLLKNIICSILYKHSNKIFYAQGVHDVCLVFITLYFHKFFIKYRKYVFLEYFIYKYVVNKICDQVFDEFNIEANNYGDTEMVVYQNKTEEDNEKINENEKNKRKRRRKKNEYSIFKKKNFSNMFSIEEEYIEKICILKNIRFDKYLQYKKKKKKKEYVVYLLCERFMLFYMIDYLTLSLNISIKNTFKSIGLLLKYIDKEVYDVFCLLQKEQQIESDRIERYKNKDCKNKKQEEKKGNGEETSNEKTKLKLNGNEFFFCLSWVLTYYSHVFTDFDKLVRIFDTLLSNSGIFIIYFTSTIILYKKKELLQLAKHKKKSPYLNNMYSETHCIFQNMEWKDLNVEDIIQKTYYLMHHKLPYEKFLKKIKQIISFPPFSPIYSYPFILHYFNYEIKKEELKKETLQKSIMNYFYMCDYMKKKESMECGNNELQEWNEFNSKENKQTISEDEVMRKDMNPNNGVYGNILNRSIESYEEYIQNILENQNEKEEFSSSSPLGGGSSSKKGKSSGDQNIYLQYPYSILCDNLEINNKIIRKHVLIEHFFEYVFFDFIVNYEYICNKYSVYPQKKYYIIHYVEHSRRKKKMLKEIKKLKRKNRYKKVIEKMRKHMTLFFSLPQDNSCKHPTMNDQKFHCVVSTQNNSSEHKKRVKHKNKNKSLLINSHNGKKYKCCKKTIGIIPPIYKYIVEHTDMNKNILSYKKIKLHPIHNITKSTKPQTDTEFKFIIINELLINEFYPFICKHFYVIFFCVTLFFSIVCYFYNLQ